MIEITYDKDYFIFGQPIEIKSLGNVRFLTYLEYLQNSPELGLISMNVLHIYYQFKKHFDSERLTEDQRQDVNKSLEELKQDTLLNVVLANPLFANAYLKIFKMVLDNKEGLEMIFDDESLFMQFRQLVMDMSNLQEEEVSPNPEIQKGLEIGKKIKQQQNKEPLTFNDIVSSIAMNSSYSFEDVANLTAFQVYTAYYRLCAKFNHQATTLFATIPQDKAPEIEAWNKHIDLFAKEESGIKRSDFDQKFGKLF